MTKRFVYLIAILFVLPSFGQVGVGTTTPSNAAMLDVSSTITGTTYRGFSPPVVTIAQRDLIAVSPTDVGLLVFVNDPSNGVVCLQYYDGTIWSCLNSSVATRTVVAQQDFEAAPAAPILTFVDAGIGATQSGTGGNPTSSVFVSGTQSYGVNNGLASITFGAVDLTAFASGTLVFKLAAFSTTTATSGGADNADLVQVHISTDGGTSFSEELSFSGTGNARFDFNGSGVIEALVDQDDNPTIHDATDGSIGTLLGLNAQSTVTLLGLPNDNDLVIRIVLLNNSANELWAIDDVILYGE
ncbi:MAG: hypothetical protein ABNH00_00835 [Dokdonia sp.]|jgi:hypothetical protein